MDPDRNGGASLAYLVHDLNDAAVGRRLDLFAGEGIVVGLAGFTRRAGVMPDRPLAVLDLGLTMDARLLQRARAVLRHLIAPDKIRNLCKEASVIVARNLEMLVLAWHVRSPGQRLVYECLDVHRMMLGKGHGSRLMRWIERRLLARTDLVIVSSPAFARDYFKKRQGRDAGILLVENKAPVEARGRSLATRPSGGETVWRIGWFGMLRCRRTLEQLAALGRSSQGKIEVVIAGIPSDAEFPDFAAQVAGCEGLSYLGPFRQEDLPRLYETVDFVWAMDYFEEGLNSSWLLPNRLYEGLSNRTVPIALRSVETGRWLERHGVGVLVDDVMAELPRRLAALSVHEHGRMLEAIAQLPEHVIYQTPEERRGIMAAIAGNSGA